MRIVSYAPSREGEDGVVVDPRCPTCARFISGKGTSVVYEGWDGNVDHFDGWVCPRCGPFQPNVIGWESDFRAS